MAGSSAESGEVWCRIYRHPLVDSGLISRHIRNNLLLICQQFFFSFELITFRGKSSGRVVMSAFRAHGECFDAVHWALRSSVNAEKTVYVRACAVWCIPHNGACVAESIYIFHPCDARTLSHAHSYVWRMGILAFRWRKKETRKTNGAGHQFRGQYTEWFIPT